MSISIFAGLKHANTFITDKYLFGYRDWNGPEYYGTNCSSETWAEVLRLLDIDSKVRRHYAPVIAGARDRAYLYSAEELAANARLMPLAEFRQRVTDYLEKHPSELNEAALEYERLYGDLQEQKYRGKKSAELEPEKLLVHTNTLQKEWPALTDRLKIGSMTYVGGYDSVTFYKPGGDERHYELNAKELAPAVIYRLSRILKLLKPMKQLTHIAWL